MICYHQTCDLQHPIRVREFSLEQLCYIWSNMCCSMSRFIGSTLGLHHFSQEMFSIKEKLNRAKELREVMTIRPNGFLLNVVLPFISDVQVLTLPIPIAFVDVTNFFHYYFGLCLADISFQNLLKIPDSFVLRFLVSLLWLLWHNLFLASEEKNFHRPTG